MVFACLRLGDDLATTCGDGLRSYRCRGRHGLRRCLGRLLLAKEAAKQARRCLRATAAVAARGQCTKQTAQCILRC